MGPPRHGAGEVQSEAGRLCSGQRFLLTQIQYILANGGICFLGLLRTPPTLPALHRRRAAVQLVDQGLSEREVGLLHLTAPLACHGAPPVLLLGHTRSPPERTACSSCLRASCVSYTPFVEVATRPSAR